MVFGIVTQLGGHVLASSELGQSSMLRVLLPVTAAPQAAPEIAVPARTVAKSDTATVLIAEDEDAGRLLVAQARGGAVAERA